jgi:four helix bundle protein
VRSEEENGRKVMTPPQSLRDSIAWQRAMELAEAVYLASRSFPKEELFGLTSQVRRAAVSVASNIAEGQGRLTKGEFAHFLGIARGSVLEVETQILLALRLGICDQDKASAALGKADEVRRILNAVLSKLRSQKAQL